MDDDTNKAIERAELLATAMQCEDWDAAARLLAPNCSYFQVARDVRGREVIIECLRHEREWGAGELDSVEQERSAGPGPDGRALITCLYHIRHKGCPLTIRSEHVIELDESGRIGRIEQIELASQANALFRFYIRVGIIDLSKGD